MSDYFWWAVNYVYDHRLTPSEAAGACASGATIGSPGGYVGAGGGCALSAISSAISKFFNIHLISDPVTGAPTIAHFDTGSFSECDTSDSCPITDFGGFGTNSNDYPTVSSGWGGYNDFVV